MFENIRNDRIRTLEPKRDLLINDINLQEVDITAVFTIIAVTVMFLISMKLVMIPTM